MPRTTPTSNRPLCKNHDPATPLDENFRFEFTRRPGETVEMELTVWNYYRQGISGTARPRLPEGWRIRGRNRLDYDLRGGTFARDVFEVVIPDAAEPGRRIATRRKRRGDGAKHGAVEGTAGRGVRFTRRRTASRPGLRAAP